MEKELNNSELEQVSGGSNSGREPTSEEYQKIEELRLLAKKYDSQVENCKDSQKVFEYADLYWKTINELYQFVDSRGIKREYKKLS